MMSKKVGVCIVGSGNIAQNSHLPVLLEQKDVEIIAICDENVMRAKVIANKYGIKHYASKFEEIVRIKDIDAIDICTWNRNHAAIAIEAAKAGKHVLCEKPMAANLIEATAVLDEVKKQKIIFMMGFTCRFKPDTIALKTLIDSGKFGKIYYCKVGCHRRRGTPIGWFTDFSKSGGGAVIDAGVHMLDLAWYLMGKPEPDRVSSSTYNTFGNFETKGVERWKSLDATNNVFDTEDSAASIIHFKNGATLLFDVSWARNGENKEYLELYGNKSGANLIPLTIFGEEENYLVDTYPIVTFKNPFEYEIRHFIDCIKENRQPISGVEDGYVIQKIISGIYDSARLKREVVL